MIQYVVEGQVWWKDSSYDTYVCGERTALMIRVWWKDSSYDTCVVEGQLL